jgi:adhesin transport system outer membrane protein
MALALAFAGVCVHGAARAEAQWGDPVQPAAPAAAAGSTQSASGPPTLGQVAASVWKATREVAEDLNPFGPDTDAAGTARSRPGALRPGAARAARIGSLAGLLGVAPALPLEDGIKGPGTRPIDLQTAMSLGVANSLDVQAAQARLESFQQTTLASFGALLPHLDSRAAVGSGQLDNVDPYEVRHREEYSITLRQSIFDLPAMREVRRQSLLEESSLVQWQGAVSSANLQVSNAYLQALQARVGLELSGDYEKLLGELLAQVTARAEAGGTSNAERDRVRARVANARSQMADSRANLRASLRTLETLIGETPAHLMIGAPPLLGVPMTPADALSEARLANRELVAARTESAASAMEASGHRARFVPTLTAEVSHTRGTNVAGTPSYSRDTKSMLVLSWQLINGGTDLAQSRAAAARAREKSLRADDLERTLEQNLAAAYASLDAVAERYAALREELAANRVVVDAFRAQLVGGNRPLLDVLDAYQRLHQSRLDMTQLVVSEVQNHLKVAHLTGRLSNMGDRPAP